MFSIQGTVTRQQPLTIRSRILCHAVVWINFERNLFKLKYLSYYFLINIRTIIDEETILFQQFHELTIGIKEKLRIGIIEYTRFDFFIS